MDSYTCDNIACIEYRDEGWKFNCHYGYKNKNNVILCSARTAFHKAIKNQRHACAESLGECSKDVSGQCIWIDEAHSKVMNANS